MAGGVAAAVALISAWAGSVGLYRSHNSNNVNCKVEKVTPVFVKTNGKIGKVPATFTAKVYELDVVLEDGSRSSLTYDPKYFSFVSSDEKKNISALKQAALTRLPVTLRVYDDQILNVEP